jgi:hypothetical protein
MTATTTPAVDPEKDLTLEGSALINAIVERHSRQYVDTSSSVTVVGGSSREWLTAQHATDYLPSVRRLRAFLEAIVAGESVAEALRRAGIDPDRSDTEAIWDLGEEPIFDTFQLLEYYQRPETPKDVDPIRTMGMLVDAVIESNKARNP